MTHPGRVLLKPAQPRNRPGGPWTHLGRSTGAHVNLNAVMRFNQIYTAKCAAHRAFALWSCKYSVAPRCIVRREAPWQHNTTPGVPAACHVQGDTEQESAANAVAAYAYLVRMRVWVRVHPRDAPPCGPCHRP